MLYREAGQFKTSYAEDQQIFPIRQDRIGIALLLLVAFALAGACAAGVGILFGLPSLRIKGFYLAVATLAAQFFVVWALVRFGWFSNYSSSGVINAQAMVIAGVAIDTPVKKYLLVL